MRIRKLNIIIAIILMFISYASVSQIIKPGYFSMHDDTQVSRVIAMGNALRNGQFPVRWVSGLGYGYGYPIFNFYGPLPYYIGGFLYSFGFAAILATKVMFLVGIFFAGVAMYKLVSEVYSIPAGLVAATLYTYAPYHAVQIFVRGSVGEYYSLIFTPILLLGLWRIFSKSSKSGFLPGSFGFAGIIISHTIFGYIAAFLLMSVIIITACYQLIVRKNLPNFSSIIYIFLGGLALTAFFWIPAVTEMGYTQVSNQVSTTANFNDHFICPSQLWDSAWGFGGSAPGCSQDGFSFKLGKLHILLAALSFLFFLFKKTKDKKKTLLIYMGIILIFLSLFFSLSVSSPVWRLLPNFSYIQYPWRLLSITNLGLSIVAGGLLYVYPKNIFRYVLAFFIIAITVFLYGKYFVPQYEYQISSSEFENIYDISWRVSRISDEYLPKNFVPPRNVNDIALKTIPDSDAWISKAEYNSETYSRFLVDSKNDENIQIQRIYFPGWIYKVNGKTQELKLINSLPMVKVSKGSNVVELQFRNTIVRMYANIISLISIVGVLYFYYGRKTYA